MPEEAPTDAPAGENEPTGDKPTGDAPKGAENVDAAKLAAEVEQWKSLARKHEDRAKANKQAADELATLKASQMSDTERAVAEAKKEGATEASKQFAERLAKAELKAALTGIVSDPAEVVDDLNIAKYVTDTGDVDSDAVKALAAKYAGLTGGKSPVDLKQGDRGAADPKQLTRADIARMTPDQIAAARAKGLLDNVLAGR